MSGSAGRLPDTESWGGRAIVSLVVCVLGYAVVGRLVDGVQFTTDADGRVVALRSGDAASLFALVTLLLAAGCSAVALLRRTQWGVASLSPVVLQAVVVWWAATSLLRDGGSSVLNGLIAALLVLGVATDPPTERTLVRLNLVRDGFVAASLAYGFLAPGTATIPCRDDKCGVFDVLLVGFYGQENTAALATAVMLPLALAARSRTRFLVSVALALTHVAASGSRTSLFACLVAVAVMLVVRSRYRNGTSPLPFSRLFRALPLAFLSLSGALFLWADATSLTGRGTVYAAIRDALHGSALFLGIPADTVTVATNGYLIGEHGQVPHLLAASGFVGLLLFALALVTVWRAPLLGRPQVAACTVLITASALFPTEPSLTLDTRSIGFCTLLVVVGCLRADDAAFSNLGGAPTGSAGVRAVTSPSLPALAPLLVGATVGAVSGLALHAVVPQHYSAQARLMAQSDAARPVDLYDAGAISAEKVQSFLSLVHSDAVLREAAGALGGGISAEELRANSHGSVEPQSSLITLSVTGPDPELVTRSVTTLCATFVEAARNLESGANAPGAFDLTVLGESRPRPDGPSVPMAMLLGGGAGLLLGGAAGQLRSPFRRPSRTGGPASPAPAPSGAKS